MGTEDAPFANDHPIAEKYRLLFALHELSLNDEDGCRAAWSYLKEPFTHPGLQHIANLAMVQVLMVSQSFSAKTQPARYQMVLRLLSDTLSSSQLASRPELSQHLQRALTILVRPTQSYPLLTIEEASGADVLMTYQTACDIAKQALAKCDDKSEEYILLQTLLPSESSYNPTTVAYFWKCPTFITLLKEHYPGKESFRLLESFIQASTQSKADILPLPPSLPLVVDKTAHQNYARALNLQAIEMRQAKRDNYPTSLKAIENKVDEVLSQSATAATSAMPVAAAAAVITGDVTTGTSTGLSSTATSTITTAAAAATTGDETTKSSIELLKKVKDALNSHLKTLPPSQDIAERKSSAKLFQPHSKQVNERDCVEFFQKLFNSNDTNPDASQLILTMLFNTKQPLTSKLKQAITAACYPKATQEQAMQQMQSTLKASQSRLENNSAGEALAKAIDKFDVNKANQALTQLTSSSQKPSAR